VLANEVDLRVLGTQFVHLDQESQASLDYRTQMNSDGSPSLAISAGYVWSPGTEVMRRPVNQGGVVLP
jgi:hypothetical protein